MDIAGGRDEYADPRVDEATAYAGGTDFQMIEINDVNGAVEFQVRVVPRASKTEIVGELAGAVKVRVTTPPVDGAANAELVKLFAKTLGVAKSSVEIVSGNASKAKRIRITGVTAENARNALC